MKNFKFYAVIDGINGGVCGATHDEYKTLKAVFSSRKEAQKAIDKNGSPDLSIREINIIEAKK